MVRLLAVLACVLLAQSAAADCAPEFGAPGPPVSPIVWKNDRRALESLLGTPIGHVICASMRPVRRFGTGFLAKRGFLVLTTDDVVFVSDRRQMEILFRTAFTDVRGLGWSVFPFRPWSPVPSDGPLDLTLHTEAETLRFTLPCAGGADRMVDELVHRTAANPGIRVSRPPGLSALNACG